MRFSAVASCSGTVRVHCCRVQFSGDDRPYLYLERSGQTEIFSEVDAGITNRPTEQGRPRYGIRGGLSLPAVRVVFNCLGILQKSNSASHSTPNASSTFPAVPPKLP